MGSVYAVTAFHRRVWMAMSGVVLLLGAACATAPEAEPDVDVGARLAVRSLPEEVTFAGEVVPINEPDVRARIEVWYNVYLSQPWRILRWMERAQEIFPIIDPILDAHGVPTDLRYLTVLESDLNARAIGPRGERGIWQFMQGTAGDYDLRMDRFIDDRNDPARSTEAAVAYFLDAAARIDGPWTLRAAAFNVGISGVTDRMVRQREADYWRMVFPPATENYVPMAIAIKLVLEEAMVKEDSTGLESRAQPMSRLPVSVSVSEVPIYLFDIAEHTGLSFRRLWESNPHIWQTYLPPGEYRIYLPMSDEPGIGVSRSHLEPGRLERYLNERPYESRSYKTDGEMTVAEIADELGIPAHELAVFNGLATGETPGEGEVLQYWATEGSG